MNYDALWILFIPVIGLLAILHRGRWRWNVMTDKRTLNVLFWIGWFGGLLVGVLRLFGAA